MPLDKNKNLRYRVLNECFRDKYNNYTLKMLLNEVNKQLAYHDLKPISESTLKHDFQHFRDEFGAEFDDNLMSGHEKVYRYIDTQFSIYSVSVEEANALTKTIDLLLQYPEPRPIQYDYVRICLQQIVQDKQLDLENPSVMFSDNLDHVGREHFDAICRYILKKQPIKISYQPYNMDRGKYNVFPYLLKQYNDRWFLVGMQEDVSSIRIWALDRILSVAPWATNYQSCPIDIESRFEEIVGVTVLTDRKIEEIKLRIAAARYKYIESKPLSPNQKLITAESNEDYKVISIPLRPNLELETLILSFGEDVEVISPQWLREKISQRIYQMMRKYK